MPPSSAQREKVGLFELTKSDHYTTVDVVAVHGLQGDAFETWQHKNGSVWIRDFLPSDVPFARIMTFGYESTIAFSKSVANIEDKALDLLNRLSAERSLDDPSRQDLPIVFICHSLGGIVAMKALILAHERSSDPRFKDIITNTKAIAFLGVPHGGSDSALWANFAANALKAASIGLNTNTALVRDLKKNSTTLTNISRQFIKQGESLRIFSFYETQKLHGVLVVDRSSAQISAVNERLFPVDADHRSICQFSSAESQKYKAVGKQIATLIGSVVEEVVSESIQTVRPPTQIYYEVPNRWTGAFVGREDILEKIKKAHSSKSSPRVVVLQAMGGQGKSSIALEYCHRLKNDALSGYSAIFWVDATSEETLKGSFESISEHIKTPTDVLANSTARISFVLRTVASWSSNWLMVFDNYDNPRSFQNIQDFIPNSDLGAILITSRHADTRALAAQENDLFVELLGIDERSAIALLVQQSGTEEMDEPIDDAKTIVEQLGYHPLAIIQARSYISKRGLRLKEFLSDYKSRKNVILTSTPYLSQYSKKLGSSEKETALNMFTTWELSFQQLERETTKDGPETKFLTLFAFFDNKDISEQLFLNRRLVGPETSKLLKWMDDYTNADDEWDSRKFEDTLIVLRDLSLLQSFERGKDGYYHLCLHPLVTELIILRTKQNFHAFQENRLIATNLLARFIEGSWRRGCFVITSRQFILANIFAQQEIWRENASRSSSSKFSKPAYLECLTALGISSDFLSDFGFNDAAILIQRRVTSDMEAMLGAENLSTLLHFFILALKLHKKGKHKEAEVVFRQCLDAFKRVLGKEHPATLLSMLALANVLLALKAYQNAEKVLKKCFELHVKVFGKQHPNTLEYMGLLGKLPHDQGRYQEAEELYRQSLASKEVVLGKDHPSTLWTMKRLALLLAQTGRQEKAEAICRECIELEEAILGKAHPDTLASMSCLALLLFYTGRHKEAEVIYRECIELRKAILGKEHPDTLATMNVLALLLFRTGRDKEAEVIYRECIELQEAILGKEHPDTLATMNDLALLLFPTGRDKEAEVIYRECIELRKAILGKEHLDTLATINNLADLLSETGRQEEAEAIYRQCIELQEAILGKEHPDTLATMHDLAWLLLDTDRHKEAERMLRQVIALGEVVLGEQHPVMIQSREGLFLVVLERQGKHSEADETHPTEPAPAAIPV